jgi:hypothetical protein
MKRRILMAAACVAFAMPAFMFGPSLDAQTPAAPAFEVASVKPNKTGDGRVMLGLQPGRFNATNVPLRMLLRQAFNVQDFQIVGGPDWLGSDRFDIIAKAPDGDFNGDVMRPMLQSLLVERFKLGFHRETRDMPIYALMKARPDGKLGPNLSASTTDCAGTRGRRGGGTATGASTRREVGLRLHDRRRQDERGRHADDEPRAGSLADGRPRRPRQNRTGRQLRLPAHVLSRRNWLRIPGWWTATREWRTTAGRSEFTDDLHCPAGTTGSQARLAAWPG